LKLPSNRQKNVKNEKLKERAYRRKILFSNCLQKAKKQAPLVVFSGACSFLVVPLSSRNDAAGVIICFKKLPH
jgi:hypothetical protein